MILPSMRFVPGALVCALALVSPTAATAQDAPAQDTAATAEDGPSAAIEYRQSVMQGLNAHRGAVIAIVDDDVEYRSHILAHATALHRLAVMAGDVFPEGSGGDDTRAKDEIWQDTGPVVEEFREALEGLQDATGGLLDAVYAGDIGAVVEAITTVRGACTGCHQTFRKPEPQGGN